MIHASLSGGPSNGLGFAWFAALLPLAEKLLAQGGDSSTSTALAPKTTQPSGNAISDLVGNLFNKITPQGTTAGPGAGKGLTPEQVQQIVNATLISKGVTAAMPTANGAKCATGFLYSTKHSICWDPNKYEDDDAAFAFMTGVTASSALPVSPAAKVAVAKAALRKAARGRSGKAVARPRTARGRGRTLHGLGGVSSFVSAHRLPLTVAGLSLITLGAGLAAARMARR